MFIKKTNIYFDTWQNQNCEKFSNKDTKNWRSTSVVPLNSDFYNHNSLLVHFFSIGYNISEFLWYKYTSFRRLNSKKLSFISLNSNFSLTNNSNIDAFWITVNIYQFRKLIFCDCQQFLISKKSEFEV